MAKLVVDSITFSYDKKDVLKDVSLEADPGQLIGILGPNGSGKTTLLKCLNRILTPKKGFIKIDGTDINSFDRKELAKRVGMVPQHNEVGFAFTALEIVLMGRSPHLGRFESEKEEDYKVVEKVMAQTNIKKFANRPITQLSGGEAQKVFIARALAQEPEILLLDEPTLHLDIAQQIEVMELLYKLREEGKLVISVLHDLNLAARYCDNLFLMKDGGIVGKGKPVEILTKKTLREVYQVEAWVGRHPQVAAPQVVPITLAQRT